MAIDRTAICNKALLAIGASLITSLTDDTKEAKVCALVYDECLWEFLSENDWSFATISATLTPNGNAPTDGYTYAYSLPNDFLRLVYNPDYAVYGVDDWRLVGNEIHCNAEEITINYISSNINEFTFHAKARTALAYLIASQVGMALSGSPEKVQMVYELYKMTLMDAIAIDSRSRAYQPVVQTPYTDVRL